MQVYIHYTLLTIDIHHHIHHQGATTSRCNNNCLQHLGWSGCDISHPGNQVKKLSKILTSPEDCELVVDVVEEGTENPSQTTN